MNSEPAAVRPVSGTCKYQTQRGVFNRNALLGGDMETRECTNTYRPTLISLRRVTHHKQCLLT